jgi:hypothetical protein
MFTKEQITEELQKIQQSIPACYLKNVLKNKKLSPTVKKVVSEAVKDESISEEKRREYQLLLDSGDLDKVEVVENKSVVKKINAWVDKKIAEAIKEGRLPSKEELTKLYENKKTTS